MGRVERILREGDIDEISQDEEANEWLTQIFKKAIEKHIPSQPLVRGPGTKEDLRKAWEEQRAEARKRL